MSDFETIIGLTVVTVLSRYLWLKHQQRALHRSGPYPSAGWTGKAMDVKPLQPAVEAARRDYLTARRPAGDVSFRRNLVELARRTIARLRYFHAQESPEHERTHNL